MLNARQIRRGARICARDRVLLLLVMFCCVGRTLRAMFVVAESDPGIAFVGHRPNAYIAGGKIIWDERKCKIHSTIVSGIVLSCWVPSAPQGFSNTIVGISISNASRRLIPYNAYGSLAGITVRIRPAWSLRETVLFPRTFERSQYPEDFRDIWDMKDWRSGNGVLHPGEQIFAEIYASTPSSRARPRHLRWQLKPGQYKVTVVFNTCDLCDSQLARGPWCEHTERITVKLPDFWLSIAP